MAIGQQAILQTRVDYIDPSRFMQQAIRPGLMGILGSLTPTPLPADSGQNLGAMPTVMFHCTITPAGGAGTYTFNHGLQWTPSFVQVIPEIAQGTTPSVVVAWDVADTSATVVAINFSGNCTADVYYG